LYHVQIAFAGRPWIASSRPEHDRMFGANSFLSSPFSGFKVSGLKGFNEGGVTLLSLNLITLLSE
jgi:hypothetical protein